MDKSSRIFSLFHLLSLVCIAVGVLIASFHFAFGKFDRQPASETAPVYLTQAEAAAYLGITAEDFQRLLDAESKAAADIAENSGVRYSLPLCTLEIEGTAYYERAALERLSGENGYSQIIVQDGMIEIVQS